MCSMDQEINHHILKRILYFSCTINYKILWRAPIPANAMPYHRLLTIFKYILSILFKCTWFLSLPMLHSVTDLHDDWCFSCKQRTRTKITQIRRFLVMFVCLQEKRLDQLSCKLVEKCSMAQEKDHLILKRIHQIFQLISPLWVREWRVSTLCECSSSLHLFLLLLLKVDLSCYIGIIYCRTIPI